MQNTEFDQLDIEAVKTLATLGEVKPPRVKPVRPDLDNLDILQGDERYTYTAYEREEQEKWKAITRLIWDYEDQIADLEEAWEQESDPTIQAYAIKIDECENILAALKTTQVYMRKHCIC